MASSGAAGAKAIIIALKGYYIIFSGKNLLIQLNYTAFFLLLLAFSAYSILLLICIINI